MGLLLATPHTGRPVCSPGGLFSSVRRRPSGGYAASSRPSWDGSIDPQETRSGLRAGPSNAALERGLVRSRQRFATGFQIVNDAFVFLQRLLPAAVHRFKMPFDNASPAAEVV